MSNAYSFSTGAGKNFERAVEVTVRELKKQGFGIVSNIDLQAIFKEKLAVDERRYHILGACNPWVAHQALRVDPDIGLLMPCNVVIREDKDGRVTVAFIAPEVLMGLLYRTDVMKLAMEVRTRLERVRDAIASELDSVAA